MKQNTNNILPGAFVCLLLISFICECFAQKFINLKTYNVDSLLLILPDQQSEERVNSLNSLAISLTLSGEDFDLSEQYAEEAMNLAKELDYQEGIAAAYRNFGYINFHQGNYPVALNNGFESIRVFEKLDKKNAAARLYYDIGIIHLMARNYEKAIEYCNISLEKFREPLEGGGTVGSVRDTATVLGGLSLTYASLGKYDKSIELRLKFLELGKRYNFGSTELEHVTFLTGAYFYSSGEKDSAKVYFHKALSYPNTNPNIEALKYRPLSWLGNVYYATGDIDSAIFFKQKAFKWYIEKGILYWAMQASNDLGSIYYNSYELNSAENYYQQSERIFNEMLDKNSWYRYDSLKYLVTYGFELYFPLHPKQMKEMIWVEGRSMYNKLYQINEAKKSTGKALKYHIAFSNAKDTLNKMMRTRETIEMQTKYETERKEGQIESLSQENAFQELKLKQSRFFLFSLGGLVILVVLFAFVLIRQNKLREQQKNLLLKQKLFRSQMNPHFIFNSLASIQHFVVKQDSKKASIYLSRFSELVRTILESSTREYITFEKEVSTIENYLELQRVRFPDKFDYSIQIDETIDAESMLIPPMLAQPFIENSIEHGFKQKKTRGNLKIRFSMKNKLIVFEVEDDGIGREKAQEILFKQNKDHISMATDITRERLMVLNKKLKQKIKLNIVDLKNEKNEAAGTKVTFDIPLKS